MTQDNNQAFVPEATAEQQRVLDRIAKQRERIRARRVARAQSLALAQSSSPQRGGADEPFAVRAMAFAKEHPAAVAGLAGMALLAGPRRLIRWAGFALPLISRLRPLIVRR